jgi:hypothetical protein
MRDAGLIPANLILEPSAAELRERGGQPDVIARLWSACWIGFVAVISHPRINPGFPIPNALAFKSEHRGGPNDITVGSTDTSAWRIRAENYAAVCDVLAEIAAATPEAAVKPERSTEPGKAKTKRRNTTPGSAERRIVSALCTYHQYSERSCGKWEPIGSNALAKLAECATGSVSRFWKKQFRTRGRGGTYEDYRAACTRGSLSFRLAVWNGEVPDTGMLELLQDDPSDD